MEVLNVKQIDRHIKRLCALGSHEDTQSHNPPVDDKEYRRGLYLFMNGLLQNDKRSVALNDEAAGRYTNEYASEYALLYITITSGRSRFKQANPSTSRTTPTLPQASKPTTEATKAQISYLFR